MKNNTNKAFSHKTYKTTGQQRRNKVKEDKDVYFKNLDALTNESMHKIAYELYLTSKGTEKNKLSFKDFVKAEFKKLHQIGQDY